MNSTTTPNKTNNVAASPSSTENWSWLPNTEESPSSSSGNQNYLNRSFDSSTQGSASRRGRPKSEILNILMAQGTTSPSNIKCKFCNRVFPRDKSLSAHLRTHTGERPYVCDFPLCNRAFTQSGQLKTHQRLHTGERPFSCSAINCQMRFTHANRHCPDHPYEALKRNDDDLIFNPQPEEQSIEILKWLQKYREDRQQQLIQQQNQSPSPTATAAATRKTPKRPLTTTLSITKDNDENKRRVFGRSALTSKGNSNCDTSNEKSSSPSKAARKGLMCELDMNAGTAENSIQSSTPVHHPDSTDFSSSVTSSPISTNKQKHCRPKVILWKEPIDGNDEDDLMNNENVLKENSTCNSAITSVMSSPVKKLINPKKKWLREAWQEDLARPLDYGTSHPLYKSDNGNWQMSSLSQTSSNPNENRPSVLMMAHLSPSLAKEN